MSDFFVSNHHHSTNTNTDREDPRVNSFDQHAAPAMEPSNMAIQNFSRSSFTPLTFSGTPSPAVKLHYHNSSIPHHAYPTIPAIPEQNQFAAKQTGAMAYSQQLSWRLDPDESLSDWILTVVSNPNLVDPDENDSDKELEEEDCDGDGQDERDDTPAQTTKSEKFFVHRTRLAVGPRRSEYFANLFHRSKGVDPNSKGTRIELRPSAADAFPTMLDFIYSPVGTPVDVAAESAIALRYLATCFGIRELFDTVSEFIKQDLSPETSPTYLVQAQLFKYDKLMQMALVVCAENFEEIKFSSIVHLTPELFALVISSEILECRSEVLSARVASYCRCRPGAIDLETLKILTDSSRMPQIAAEESLFYLRLIAEADDDVSTEGGRSKRIDGKNGLYQRCIKASKDIVRLALLDKFPSKERETRPKKNAIKEYHTLPNSIKVDLLEHALAQAPTQGDLDTLENERNEMKRKQMIVAKKQIDFVEKEVEKLKRRYEKKLASYEARIEVQEEELQAYTDELSRFIRVPNDHRVAPITSEYTYQSRPRFSEAGESLYGAKAPSALPRFGHRNVDGWVLHENEWRRDGRKKTKIWPVYYYKRDGR